MPTTAPLDLQVHDQGTTRLVALNGEIDIATVDRARAVLRDSLDGVRETVVVDLAGVTFTDSSGVHLLVDATALARARRMRLVVLPGPPHVQTVFSAAGVAGEMPFARTAGHLAG